MADKGELAFSTIVTAVIALTVLVILVVIIGDKFNLFKNETNKCELTGGKCVIDSECFFNTGIQMNCAEGQVCCVNNCESAKGNCVAICEGDECNRDCPKNSNKIHFKKCPNGQVCCG